MSFFWSFTKYNVIHAPKFIGLDNYKNILFHDSLFWKAVGNTVIYVLGVVPIGICISLILAVAIDQKIKFKNFFNPYFSTYSYCNSRSISYMEMVIRW